MEDKEPISVGDIIFCRGFYSIVDSIDRYYRVTIICGTVPFGWAGVLYKPGDKVKVGKLSTGNKVRKIM